MRAAFAVGLIFFMFTWSVVKVLVLIYVTLEIISAVLDVMGVPREDD